MAITRDANGTQTATVTTEHSLSTRTAAGIYQLVVDLSNMVNGDEVELRVKHKVLSGSSAALEEYAIYVNAQDIDVVRSVPIPSVDYIEFTLKQTVGTGRNFDWAVLKL